MISSPASEPEPITRFKTPFGIPAASKIVVMRTDGGRSSSYPFNYRDVIKRKNIQQNIELKPGDTVVVP